MKQIAATDHYTLGVDTGKNRLVLSMKGSWTRANDVPHFFEHLTKALIPTCAQDETMI